METSENFEIVLVSSGHQAMDHRVFHKEAVSLAKHFSQVRVVAVHAANDVVERVHITALPPCRNRFERFALRPLRCLLAARGPGQRVVILHDAELLFWVPLVKLFTGWRIIYDVHEDFPQLLLRRRWIPVGLRRLVSPGIACIERWCSRACDGIIGVTGLLTEAFHHPRRVAIYNLPSRSFLGEAAKLACPLPAREYALVHLGTLSEERLEFLCEILTALWQRQPDARALIIGVRPDQEQALKVRLPAEQATVIGKVDYRQVATLLGNCSIGLDIHPILYPHLRCAVPVKIFEYMASGCNVVTSYLPELSRLLGAEGEEHVVTISTPAVERFVEEICRLLADPESLQQHQQALMHLVSTRWNWEQEEAKLVAFVAHTMIREQHASNNLPAGPTQLR